VVVQEFLEGDEWIVDTVRTLLVARCPVRLNNYQDVSVLGVNPAPLTRPGTIAAG